MIDLPDGWASMALGDVAEVRGGIQKQPKRRPLKNTAPFLRVANVLRGRLDLTEVHEIELFDGELAKYELDKGDLLVVEGNGSPDQIGRSSLWNGEISNCVHQNHLIRVRPGPKLDPEFLNLYWNSPATSRALSEVASSTSGLYTLSTTKLKRLMVPVPPLDEQNRIVDAIEERFSRIDAAKNSVRSALRRSQQLQDVVLNSLSDAPHVSLGSISTNANYGTSVKCSYESDGVPVCRIPNIRDRKLDLTDMKYATQAVGEAAMLSEGDILFVRTNGSRDLIGRVAVSPALASKTAFASYLIRVQVDAERANPDYLALALSAPSVRQYLMASAKSTAGQLNLNLRKIADTQVPLPSLEIQREVIEKVNNVVTSLNRVLAEATAILGKSEGLKRSTLSQAFSGGLVPQHPSEEPALLLLERILAQRSNSTGKPIRKKKVSP